MKNIGLRLNVWRSGYASKTSKKKITHDHLLARFLLVLVVAGACVFSFLPIASAGTVSISGVGGNITIHPNDKVQAGYSLRAPDDHGNATVNVLGGMVQLTVVCQGGSSRTLSISFPAQQYSLSQGNKSWIPSGSVVQGSTLVPANLCGTGSWTAQTRGATFTANVTSTRDCDDVDMRFHVKKDMDDRNSDEEPAISKKKCSSPPCCKCEGEDDNECEHEHDHEHDRGH